MVLTRTYGDTAAPEGAVFSLRFLWPFSGQIANGLMEMETAWSPSDNGLKKARSDRTPMNCLTCICHNILWQFAGYRIVENINSEQTTSPDVS